MPHFETESTVPFPPEHVFAWHERPGAFERLSPPWADVRVVEREGGIRDGARVVLRVRKGPLDLTGEIRHTGYEEGRRFCDEQVKGPLSSYRHEHRFEPSGDGGCRVIDDIEWEPPMASAVEAFTTPVLGREFERLFRFRHERLRSDLEVHARYAERPRLKVAISGSTGFIGHALSNFLTSGGHEVIPMVRSKGLGKRREIYWNWEKGEIDEGALEEADAVVHLAGEPLIGLRWTSSKKQAIRESRVKGTELIARTMAGLHGGPDTLVSASAVGFYGGRGNEILDESSQPGRGFLAEVCKAWEQATARADRSGVRVVRLRTGFVLSPSGGALGNLLIPFQVGLGGRVGSGKQYLPWIDLDDAIGIIYHTLMTPGLDGPFNVTAPSPVPQATFATVLGRVLGRPTVLPMPSIAVKALLGEMGRETLLQGQRAKPERALDTGYEFVFEGLEESLRHKLGKAEG